MLPSSAELKEVGVFNLSRLILCLVGFLLCYCVPFHHITQQNRRELSCLYDLYFMYKCYIAFPINEYVIYSVMTFHFVTGICANVQTCCGTVDTISLGNMEN